MRMLFAASSLFKAAHSFWNFYCSCLSSACCFAVFCGYRLGVVAKGLYCVLEAEGANNLF